MMCGGRWWLLGLLSCAAQAATRALSGEVKNVAIIGAGPAGASAAYHLRRYAEERELAINITLFESTNRIGGRTLTVDAYEDPALPVELGASIFVKINHIMYNATQQFHLPLGGLSDGEPGDITAIWDGQSFVYESLVGESSWWEAMKMFWKYGTSPYYALNLMRDTVGQFLNLYEEPWFPFRSLTQRCFELGLTRITGITGEQFLLENKINPKFSRQIIQAATRVNYASNLGYIHGLESMVSIATDGAVSVQGGNWRIFDNMVKHSGANFYPQTAVRSIQAGKDGPAEETTPSYVLSTNTVDDAPHAQQDFPVSFDKVIIASPWQFANITAGEQVLTQLIDAIPYTKLHVTLFASPFKLRPGFFGLAEGSKSPKSVYTTLNEDDVPHQGAEGVGPTGIYSVSTLRNVLNPRTSQPEYVYKIFSAAELTPDFLADLLGAPVPDTFVGEVGGFDEQEGAEATETITWYYPHWFHSYPMGLPRVTFQDPIVGDGIYYTSGMESFISTMETSALMGMNVARLIADDFAGTTGQDYDEASRGRGAATYGQKKDDFFESMDSDFFGGLDIQGPGEL